MFLNKYEDIILGKAVCPESILPTPCLRPDNIGSADVKGFELEATINPGGGLSIDGSLSYLDFEYTSPTTQGYLDGTIVWAGGVEGGTALSGIPGSGITPYTPELAASLGVQYDHMLGGGTLSFRADGAYQDELFTGAENTSWSRIPSRFLTNARVSWIDDDDWRVSLEVQNVLDKYYFQSVSDVSTSLGVVTGVPGLPRTFAVSYDGGSIHRAESTT